VAPSALRLVTVVVVAGVLGSWLPALGQADSLAALNGVSANPPSSVPDIAFRALDGRQVRLAEFRGRPVLLTFFTTW
jgi:cytochrome oxidase Cu insertion factor (SCO1/SenC/PrrC family)